MSECEIEELDENGNCGLLCRECDGSNCPHWILDEEE
jgi:hypothetical protein